MYIFYRFFFSISNSVMRSLLIIQKTAFYFMEKIIMCCCHGYQFIAYHKCKKKLMTSYIASVTSSNESVNVHILMQFDKCFMKRLKHTCDITVK